MMLAIIKSANVIAMDDNGSRYALSALKRKRGELATEIVELERKLRHRKELLVHVDATLKLLDPSVSPAELPNRKPKRRIKLFRQGELGRAIRDALRVAGGRPLSTAEIVEHVIAAGGHGPEARKAVGPRVRGNLAYLQRQGVVMKDANQRDARWSLVSCGFTKILLVKSPTSHTG